MNKILVFLSLIIISYWLLTITAVAAKSEITTNELGVKNPGMLPSSPFYFLKEWQRSITKVLTFNPIKKVELELQYADERAAEIKKMEEVAPKNVQAITKAVNNYQKNMEQLREQLQKVETASQNPNIDNLINNVIDTSNKHRELFDNLKDKFEDDANLGNELEIGQQKISEIINTIQPATSTIATSTIATSTPVFATSTITTSTIQ